MVSRSLIASVLFCVILLLSSTSHSQQIPLQFKPAYRTVHGGLKVPVEHASEDIPRLGLALSGGGAKAAASIGVLKVLQREGIPVAAVAGTSMGAGVGALLAAGYSADEIERLFLANDWNDIFSDQPARAYLTQEQKESAARHLLEFTFQQGRLMPPYGLSAGQKLANLLAAKTLAASFEADLDFDRLRIPFRAIATDIETGQAVVIDHGLLHEAARASMAIPLVFQPVEVQGRLLVDGGLANNLPVEVVRSMGPEVVIAIDSSAKLEKKERLVSLVEIISQSISLHVRRESERQADLADLVITPDTSDYSFSDFPSIKEIIRRGEDAARAALPRIRELMRTRKKPDTALFRITKLTIKGNANVPEESIRSAMAHVFFPFRPTASDMRKALADVFALGVFSDVSLSIKKEAADHYAILTVAENPVISSIAIEGNTIVPTGVILPGLQWQIGQPLNSVRVAGELDKLVARCRGEGYLLTRVERIEVKPGGVLRIVLYEGRVDAITVIGNVKTSRRLIRRETITATGKPLNFEDAAFDVQHLYALDYFESVSMEMAKSARGGIDLTLKIKEKPTNKIRLGLRYDLEDHFTGLTDIMVDNVGGRGVSLFLNTRYGNYTDLTFGYRSPVVLRMNFLHRVDGFYRDRNYFIYQNKQKVQELDITRKGAEFTFGYQWFRFGDTYLRYRFVSDTRTEILGMNPPEEVSRIASWAFLSTVDTRDSSTFPHTGTLFNFSYEKAEPSFGGDVSYVKSALHAQISAPLADRHTAVLEGTAGIGSGSIPYEEKYGIGGADHLISTPLIGYQRREFTGNDILAFSASYRYRVCEYQLSMLRAVYLNLAYQAANVWDSRDAMSAGDLRSGAGIGLYADTIIGPVRLDFARGEQNRWAVYFSAGFDF